MLRKIMDKVGTMFETNKFLRPLYPMYEAIDTFLYTPKYVAAGSVHVRDSLCLKRTMTTVMIAVVPCVLMAMFNTGFQAFSAMKANGLTEIPVSGSWLTFQWQAWLMQWLLNASQSCCGPFALTIAPAGTCCSWIMYILTCMIFGALYFIPVYVVTFVVGILWELLFASVKHEEINEGFFVTSLLLPCTLPATIPLWQVAIAITFGVVVAKELFGGVGRNFLNPALAARAFLFFTFASNICGDSMWVAVDGISQATPLGLTLTSGMEGIRQLAAAQGLTEMQYWFYAFFGLIPGSMGETSTLACLIGAVLLVYTGIGSWRIMASLAVGAIATSGLFYFMYATGMTHNPVFGVSPHWHFVLGGLAFGMVFMATDPVTGSMTLKGQYIYGFLIGFLVLMVRVLNPAYPEGVMLAILFGNVCAPTIDYFFVRANIKRRELRNV